MVRRNEVDVLRGVYIEPISAYVEALLMATIDTLQRLDLIALRLYHTFARVNSSRPFVRLAGPLAPCGGYHTHFKANDKEPTGNALRLEVPGRAGGKFYGPGRLGQRSLSAQYCDHGRGQAVVCDA